MTIYIIVRIFHDGDWRTWWPRISKKATTLTFCRFGCKKRDRSTSVSASAQWSSAGSGRGALPDLKSFQPPVPAPWRLTKDLSEDTEIQRLQLPYEQLWVADHADRHACSARSMPNGTYMAVPPPPFCFQVVLTVYSIPPPSPQKKKYLQTIKLFIVYRDDKSQKPMKIYFYWQWLIFIIYLSTLKGNIN